MDTKKYANRIAAKYATRNPFEFVQSLDYIVIFTALSPLRGFYQLLNRCNIIYLDDSLDEVQQKLVCAHELFHSLEHRTCNRIFLDTRTFLVTSRYEIEANQFSVDFVFEDSDLQAYLDYSIPQIAHCLGINEKLAEYRMLSVEPKLY